MVSKGWIKLWRKLLDSDMYAELNSKQRDVMIQCLLLANHKERQWEWHGEIHKCEPGQFKTSLEQLKKRCAPDVSIQSVRTALLKLKKWQFLTDQSTKSGRIITVCNWLIHQDEDLYPNKDVGKELTKSQQRANKELTTNKNNKELKNEKNEKEIYIIFEKYKKIFKGIYEPRKLTPKIELKIKARLKEFKAEELILALQKIKEDDFIIGKNPNGKVYCTPEYCFRSYEMVEKWLNQKGNKQNDPYQNAKTY